MMLIVQDGRATAAPPGAVQDLFAAPGVFETLRVDRLPAYPNAVSLFRLSHHLDRLRRSAEACGCIVPDVDALKTAIDTALRSMSWGQVSSARLRVFAHRESWCVSVSDLGELLPAEGVRLVTIAALRDLPEHKRCPAPISVGARAEARARGADEALLIGDKQTVLEGAWSSFLWFDTRGVLRTADSKVLPGVTCRAVLDCLTDRVGALRASQSVVEEAVSLEALMGCISEAFVTNAMNGIVPVLTIDGISIGSGQRGPLTAQLQQQFREYHRQHMEVLRLPQRSHGTRRRSKNASQ